MVEEGVITIVDNGEERVLGCQPRVIPVGGLFAVYSDVCKEDLKRIPRSEWKPVSYRSKVVRIMDQDGVGACNAFAACQTVETLRSMCGQVHVDLYPGNLYGRINGGRDVGSSLGDALEALKKEGICPQPSGVAAYAWRSSNWPSDWRVSGKKYRILEAYDCPEFDDIASAIQCGCLVDYGINVGIAFKTDEDGWVYEGGGRGGHAMCGIGLAYRDGKWGVETANSWATTWGNGGFGVVPESYFRGQFNDAWAVRAVVSESSDQIPAVV